MNNNRYSISVTQDDINEGVRDQSAHCIVATAIGRSIPDATRISVDVQSIRFTIGKERLIFMTPREVAKYVMSFDAGSFASIKPMKLELSNPLVAESKPKGATRLIVKGTQGKQKRTAPTRTRSWGLRTFEVNRTP